VFCMHRYARDCPTSAPEITPIERPFSLFSFLEHSFPNVPTLRRILSQVRSHGGKTLVVEQLNIADAEDLTEENEDIAKRFGAVPTSHAWRLSFFTKKFDAQSKLESVGDKDFIGYAIIKRDEVPGGPSVDRIYESVLRPSRQEHNYIRAPQKWSCCVGPTAFQVCGYLYAQQNNMTNVCAHVACRTAAARFHKDGDMTYREMNGLPGVNVDHVNRTVGEGQGLNSDEMIKILEAAGARCVVGDYVQPKPPVPFQKLLYGSVESGYPAIICFATKSGATHAVPVFGHTFNEDTWVPRAEGLYFRVGAQTEYIPSESWLSTYIAHDDNCGSNYCIPRHFLYAKRQCDNWPTGAQPCDMESECVAYVIATLPSDVHLNPLQAEVIGVDYLFSMLSQLQDLAEPWGRRLDFYAKNDQLVIRPILIDISTYVQHLEMGRDWDHHRFDKKQLDALRAARPQRVWMVELSVPELFSANRRKVGEVLLLADVAPSTKRDFGNFLLARIPGYFVLHAGGTATNPQYNLFSTGVEGHFPLFDCKDS